MNKKRKELKAAPATVTFINGRKHITITISNTQLSDWIDKQEIQTSLHISNRTLQTMRSHRQIPFTTFGKRSYRYYLPGILALLEQNVLC